jgi:hypothetical protein
MNQTIKQHKSNSKIIIKNPKKKIQKKIQNQKKKKIRIQIQNQFQIQNQKNKIIYNVTVLSPSDIDK